MRFTQANISFKSEFINIIGFGSGLLKKAQPSQVAIVTDSDHQNCCGTVKYNST